MLELGALFLRTETELLLNSRCVYPQILLYQGFNCNYVNTLSVFYNLIYDGSVPKIEIKNKQIIENMNFLL